MRSFGGTHVGRRRSSNEDAYLCDDELGLWVVADGMGGHAAGEVASREAIDTIHGMVRRGKLDLARSPSASPWAACRLLEGAVQAATYMVFAIAEQERDKTGMGTTISAMMREGDHLVIAQVGDSRIYRVRGSETVQLTEDHTLVAWQVKHGIITPEQAAVSKERNVVTRAVGNQDYVQVDTSCHEADTGDAYLLCSDGLHGYLRTHEIAEICSSGGQVAIERFIQLANARGGRDNITAILLDVT
jgi:serine/threonine protein phosphatase PrpC